jgi:hypothetical protein
MYIKDSSRKQDQALCQFLTAALFITIAACFTIFMPAAYATDLNVMLSSIKDTAKTICRFGGAALVIVGLIRFGLGFSDGGSGPEVRQGIWMIGSGALLLFAVPGMIDGITMG